MPYNLCVFVLNTRVTQLFDGVIMIASIGHFIEEHSCGSGEDIDLIKTRVQAIVPIVFFRVEGETFFWSLLVIFNHDVEAIGKF